MMKWLALAALLAIPCAQAQSNENDGFWFAENLVSACGTGLKIERGELPPPPEGDESAQMAASMLSLGCSGYVRGFAEAVAAVPRYEVNGVCIEAQRGRMEDLLPQMMKTAADHPEMVAPRAPSAALMLRSMAVAYPCS